MFKVQTVVVANEHYFVCNATGVLIKSRFFIPSELNNDDASGAFITLPVAVRYLYDMNVNKSDIEDIKADMCKYFEQDEVPAHPITPVIPVDPVPHLDMMELGQSWKLVQNAQHIDTYLQKNKNLWFNRVPAPIKAVSSSRKRSRPAFKIGLGVYLASQTKPCTLVALDIAKLARKLVEFSRNGLKTCVASELLLFYSTKGEENVFARNFGLCLHGDIVVVTGKQIELAQQSKKRNLQEDSAFQLLFDE